MTTGQKTFIKVVGTLIVGGIGLYIGYPYIVDYFPSLKVKKATKTDAMFNAAADMSKKQIPTNLKLIDKVKIENIIDNYKTDLTKTEAIVNESGNTQTSLATIILDHALNDFKI